MKFTLLYIFIFLCFGAFAQSSILDKPINQTDENNQKQGYWMLYYSDGQVLKSEGSYVNNKKEGLWKTYFPNGTIQSEITYIDGKTNGHARLYYKNGSLSEEGLWKGDKWIGEYKFYYQNGNVGQELTYNESGKKDGTQKYFYENGKVHAQGTWNRGRRNGEYVEYAADGSIKSAKKFDNGVFVSNSNVEAKQASPLPSKINADAAQNGIKPDVFTGSGYNTIYNEHKKIDQEGEFKRGKLINGTKFIYSEKGQLQKTLIYKNGEPSEVTEPEK